MLSSQQSQRCHPIGVQDFNPYRRVPPPPPRLSKTFETHIDDLELSLDQISEVRHAVGKISRNRSIPPREDSPYASHSLVSRTSTPALYTPRPPSNPRPNTGKSRATVRNGRSSRPSVSVPLFTCKLNRIPLNTHNHTSIHTGWYMHNSYCCLFCAIDCSSWWPKRSREKWLESEFSLESSQTLKCRNNSLLCWKRSMFGR